MAVVRGGARYVAGHRGPVPQLLSILPVGDDSGLGDGVAAVGVGFERGLGVRAGEFVYAGGVFILGVEEVVEGDFAAGVGGGAAHAGDQAGFDAALHFVV